MQNSSPSLITQKASNGDNNIHITGWYYKEGTTRVKKLEPCPLHLLSYMIPKKYKDCKNPSVD